MGLTHITLFYKLGGRLKGASLLRATLFPDHFFLRHSHFSVATRAILFPNHVFLSHFHGPISTRSILFPSCPAFVGSQNSRRDETKLKVICDKYFYVLQKPLSIKYLNISSLKSILNFVVSLLTRFLESYCCCVFQ